MRDFLEVAVLLVSSATMFFLGTVGNILLWVFPLGDFMGYTLGWPVALVLGIALFGSLLCEAALVYAVVKLHGLDKG